jgi:nucleotide-binding universal stress UspA family protein
MGLKLEHLLVPVDFGETSLLALERAIGLAADYRADVTLLHVIERPFFGFDGPAEAEARDVASERLHALVRERVRALRQLHAWRGVVMTEVAVGSVADEIVSAIDHLDVDLVVLGASTHSALAHAVRSGTAERVIRSAPCPVVVVRAQKGAPPDPEPERTRPGTLSAWGLAA